MSIASLANARAPGKVILIGEHAVNRGQLALAASVGLHTTCTVRDSREGLWTFVSGEQRQDYRADELIALARRLEAAIGARDYGVVTATTAQDFFTSSAFLTGFVLRSREIAPLEVSFRSELPIGFGLGSGGAAHVALGLAVGEVLRQAGVSVDATEIAEWALWGDRIVHGGVASGLDTQTSLQGGVIEYRDGESGRALQVAPGLRLVIGNTGIAKGTTGSVNVRVRRWLEEDPARMETFQELGRLALDARAALKTGDWPTLGQHMDEAHVCLQRIGASHPQLDALCEAARRAGAFGAKLTGAGGGGVMIALVDNATETNVAEAIRGAGGTPLVALIGVAGASLIPEVQL